MDCFDVLSARCEQNSMYNLEEGQSSNTYCRWNMVTGSNVSTHAYTVPLTLMNRRQEVVL
jgi:hypothetical protein